MKAITIIQPWATLIAIGNKQIETRSWSTKYRGPLAIHAGKNTSYVQMKSKNYILGTEPFYSIITRYTNHLINQPEYILNVALNIHKKIFPIGAVIAVCNLTNCVEIKDHTYMALVDDSIDKSFAQKFAIMPPPEPERSFGDYTPGRYAWILEDVKPIDPVFVNGALGLWEWDVAYIGNQ